jgi:hypothetical protein
MVSQSSINQKIRMGMLKARSSMSPQALSPGDQIVERVEVRADADGHPANRGPSKDAVRHYCCPLTGADPPSFNCEPFASAETALRDADTEIAPLVAKGRSDRWLTRVDEDTALSVRQIVNTTASDTPNILAWDSTDVTSQKD